ncbi:HD-GYP domain-containing protein [Paenibacillus sp. MBLB4367]|uniref:HD-GYP domain-containing protein n=1 Tax=Paenibacillus sp. MBLB4367 TaxID=3384767 RepID=UPI0039083DA4
MRLVPTTDCLPGMRLGKAVFSEEGNILLGAHVELSESLINRLYKMGFDFLFIEDGRTEDIAIRDPISDETRRVALQAIHTAYRTFGKDPDPLNTVEYGLVIKQLRQVMTLILDELSAEKQDTIMLLNMNVMKPDDWEKSRCQNALNVCMYAAMMGNIEGYSPEQLETIALGSLLHDVGNAKIPSRLLRKASKLTPYEYKEVQKHTEIGYELIRSNMNVHPDAALCVLQHHERIDGNGYPHGIRGKEILEQANWIGLLDAYDAMTNPRAYRQALLPHEALDILFGSAGTCYDLHKVRLFRNHIAIYPIGMSVTLSTGESGIVSGIHPLFKHRPTVRVLHNPKGEPLKIPYEVDLSTHLSIMIDSVAGHKKMLSNHAGLPAAFSESIKIAIK